MKFFFTLFSIVIIQYLNAQNIQFAKTVVDSLCSPAFYGRGFAFNGDSLASEYVAGLFSESGLEPVHSSYFQPYPVEVNIFPGKVSLTLNHMNLIPGKDFIISPEARGIHGKFNVINLVQDDLTSVNRLLSDLKKSTNKIIIIDKRTFSLQNDSVNLAIVQLVQYLKFDTIFNPAGVIIFSNEKLTWSTGISVDRRPVIYSNFTTPPKVHSVTLDIDQEFISATPRNVIAEIPGRENDSVIVITAHYDHLGMMGETTMFPGANDNASGTALMLDLAGELFKIRDSLNLPIVFLAFSGEEAGLLGSMYFVQHPIFNLGKIKFLINLDLAGTGNEGIMVVNATKFKKEFEMLLNINQSHQLLPAVKSRGEACNSDHCLFYRNKVPCFFIYTLGGIQAYHDIYDRAETLPLTAYKNYFLLLKYFILQLANDH